MRALRIGPVSTRVDLTGVVVSLVAWAVTLVIAAVSLTIGDFEIPLPQVLDTLAGNGSLIMTDVVVNNRLPRVLVAMGVGTALGSRGRSSSGWRGIRW